MSATCSAFAGSPTGAEARSQPSTGRSRAAVAIPVKAFSKAKLRLSPVLAPPDRAALARLMAERVIRACAPLPAFIVCDDPEVAVWAENLGASALTEAGLGLNGAISSAVSKLSALGYERLIIAHSDLALATQLAWLAELDGIVLVPDRHGEGTNVISLPAGCDFRFSYGPGSFSRHKKEALRTGLAWRVIRDPELAWDIDSPADMAVLV